MLDLIVTRVSQELPVHEDIQHAFQFVSFIVRRAAELRVRQQGVEHPQIGMAQCRCILGQIKQVSNQNVHEDVQVVGVEVFVGWRGGEEQV